MTISTHLQTSELLNSASCPYLDLDNHDKNIIDKKVNDTEKETISLIYLF